MFKCGCGMMIECEVKTGQTVESIEHTRIEGYEGVGVKIRNRKMMDWPQSKEMRWEIKRFERGKTGEDIRREGGEMVGMKI